MSCCCEDDSCLQCKEILIKLCRNCGERAERGNEEKPLSSVQIMAVRFVKCSDK